MIYVLGEPEDTDVLWLAVALRARGHDVEVVLPHELMFGSRLTIRIGSDAVAGELRLADGRVLDPSTLDLVVNRLSILPPTRGEAVAADALFLAEEWRAALAAWLRTLACPVLNPPRAASLAGPMLPEASWRAIAHAFGLPCQPWRSDRPTPPTDPVTLTCVGERCIDAQGIASENTRRSLVAMAAYVGAPLLSATFDRAATTPELVEVSVFPELRAAGDPLLDALVDLATQRGDAA